MVSVHRGKVPRAVRAYGRMVCLGEIKEGFPGEMTLELISDVTRLGRGEEHSTQGSSMCKCTMAGCMWSL